MISDEDLKKFEEDGYLHIKSVFTRDDMEKYRKEMDDLANGLFTVRLDLHKHGLLRDIHSGKVMCDIADRICGGRAIPVGSTSFYCKPNNSSEFGSIWHQDNFAPMCPNGGNYLNLALSVDDAAKENGSLIVVRGSHKWGMLKFKPSQNFSTNEEGKLVQIAPIGDAQTLDEYSMPDGSRLPQEPDIRQLEYGSGDVLVIHGLLVHKAKKNEHPTKWRRTTYFVYVKEKEPFWPGWNAKRELLERYDSPAK